jgi:hypothetical protein
MYIHTHINTLNLRADVAWHAVACVILCVFNALCSTVILVTNDNEAAMHAQTNSVQEEHTQCNMLLNDDITL